MSPCTWGLLISCLWGVLQHTEEAACSGISTPVPHAPNHQGQVQNTLSDSSTIKALLQRILPNNGVSLDTFL